MSAIDDSHIKGQLFDLFDDFRKLFFEAKNAADFEQLLEEDVKVKLVYPLFQVLGWNVHSYSDAEMEYGCGYRREICENLKRTFPSYKFDPKKWDTEYEVDCVLKTENKPYIFLETKRFKSDISRLASLEEPSGFRIIENALGYPEVKYVVFTNFLKMFIIDTKTKTATAFEDMSEYVSNFEKLRVLMKPNFEKKSANLTSINLAGRPECYENFKYAPEKCGNCANIQRYICETTTKLKHLGYPAKSIE